MADRSSKKGTTPATPESGLERRQVLKMGAGLAALGLGSSLRGQEPETAAATTTLPTQEPAAAQPAAPVPSAEGLLDPRTLRVETWLEPWTWRPEEWPEEPLYLHVVEHLVPGPASLAGNPNPKIFSFGGNSPAPTIRMRGDGTLRIKLLNHLGLDQGFAKVGPGPDPAELPREVRAEVCVPFNRRRGIDREDPTRCPLFFDQPEEFFGVVPFMRVPSWAVREHANGQHSAHVTNLHTHGLHVTPNANPDGTQSDNVLLRVLSRPDWQARQRAEDPILRFLGPNERVGKVDFVYRLGNVMRSHGQRHDLPPQPQPPGTHWYHPHAHGSTHDQVASGMAGFLILEGDVDLAVNRLLTGEDRPDPQEKTGPRDYRERLILIQRAEMPPLDRDAGPKTEHLKKAPAALDPSRFSARAVAFMRPGAVERWRVLNGSVDGRGFKRFMVLRGQFVQHQGALWRVVSGETEEERRLEPVTRREIEEAKEPLFQLAADGITLVKVDKGQARYFVKDLSKQNALTENPLNRPPAVGEGLERAMLRNVEDCYRSGDSIRRSWVRPNEVFLGPANRADLFFEAPRHAADELYTLLAQEVVLHTDNFQQRLQWVMTNKEKGDRPPVDLVLGYVHVRDEPVDAEPLDVATIDEVLPPVPPFLQPIGEDELRVPAREARARAVPEGSFRSRVVSYSGWGGFEAPLVEVPESFATEHPELEKLVWVKSEGTPILLTPHNRTMAINSRFDLALTPEPAPPQKFCPDDPTLPHVLVDTAEEWALYNSSVTLWSHTDTERFPQPGQYGLHYRGYPLSRAEGQARFALDPEFQITSKGADHPFHIHINPCWVTRIDIPDENGELHNILDEPRWLDTMWIPRNGGRVVFRTRYPDYIGRWVHHCHILLHEDNGMMQIVEGTNEAEKSDYNPRQRVASLEMSGNEVDSIYPKPSLDLCYRQSLQFVDRNPTTGQVYPGFSVEVPKLEDDESSRFTVESR